MEDDKEEFSGSVRHEVGPLPQLHSDAELDAACTALGGVCLIALLDATSPDALQGHLNTLEGVRSTRRCEYSCHWSRQYGCAIAFDIHVTGIVSIHVVWRSEAVVCLRQMHRGRLCPQSRQSGTTCVGHFCRSLLYNTCRFTFVCLRNDGENRRQLAITGSSV